MPVPGAVGGPPNGDAATALPEAALPLPNPGISAGCPKPKPGVPPPLPLTDVLPIPPNVLPLPPPPPLAGWLKGLPVAMLLPWAPLSLTLPPNPKALAAAPGPASSPCCSHTCRRVVGHWAPHGVTTLRRHQLRPEAHLIQLALADRSFEAASSAAKRCIATAKATTAVAGKCWR
jgi:hypothetical protein